MRKLSPLAAMSGLAMLEPSPLGLIIARRYEERAPSTTEEVEDASWTRELPEVLGVMAITRNELPTIHARLLGLKIIPSRR